MLLKVQVTDTPAVTVKLVVDPPPQVALVSAQPAVTASLRVYVPAGTLIVVLPLPPDVVTLGEAALVPLTVKSNVPFAPMVFLTIMICPCAAFVKVQVTVAPAATLKLVVDAPPQLEPVGVQPAAADSLMVYVPGRNADRRAPAAARRRDARGGGARAADREAERPVAARGVLDDRDLALAGRRDLVGREGAAPGPAAGQVPLAA